MGLMGWMQPRWHRDRTAHVQPKSAHTRRTVSPMIGVTDQLEPPTCTHVYLVGRETAPIASISSKGSSPRLIGWRASSLQVPVWDWSSCAVAEVQPRSLLLNAEFGTFMHSRRFAGAVHPSVPSLPPLLWARREVAMRGKK